VVADAEPLPPPGVVDLDRDPVDGDQLTRLPRPRKMRERVAADVLMDEPPGTRTR